MDHGLSLKDHVALAIAVVVIVVLVLLSALTPIGVLFSAANPYGNVYGYSMNAVLKSEALKVPGLYGPVKIILDRYGVYHIYASNLHDLFLAFGFIEAENRLWQMDIMRRAAIGNLSPILGPSYRSSDLFQLKIGNLITAEKDWNETLQLAKEGNPIANETVMALEAYSQGVNDYIRYAKAHHELPFEFTLLRYKPQNWTPVDSFAIQQYMVESLEFGDDGLVLSLLYYKMGNLANALVPVFSPIPQLYYAGYNGTPNLTIMREAENVWPINSTIAQMAYELYREWDPPFITSNPPDHSNEWIVAGWRTNTGHPILVGGPVLAFTLPFIWFEAQLSAPGFDVFGVFLPGAPVAVIGFNQHIAWTLTDVQAIGWGTYFFVQTVNSTDYYFNGSWHPIRHYYVNGIELNWTNWGPIMIENHGLAIVMYWLGNNYSNDIGVLLAIARASNWRQFYSALEQWHVPYQNFAFADNESIGDVSAGIYPIFASMNGLPYSPDAIMPGDGQEYITGWVPYTMIPHVYNPPNGIIVSSNQRQVGPSYPYWYGDTMSFSPGTRAWVVYDYLKDRYNMTLQDMMKLQQNVTDLAAVWTLPTIISALKNISNPYARMALSYLEGWNGSMLPNSKAATVWFYLYSEVYFNVIYGLFNKTGFWPEFSAIRPGPAGGSWPGTISIASLDEDIIHLLITGNGSPIYNGSVNQLIVNSTVEAMKLLLNYYHNGNFTWANFYGFYWPSLTGVSALSVGPISSKGGDYFTLNDNPGGGGGPLPTSPAPGGQSFMFVANLANLSDSYGVYAGGQSENPASPFYDNYIPLWVKGVYLPLLFYPSYSQFPSSYVLVTINMKPG